MRKISVVIFMTIAFVFLPTITLAQSKSDSIRFNRNKAIRYAHKKLNGIGTELDYKKAYIVLKKLAESGDAEACNTLGMMYKQGLWVKKNDKKALYLFMIAAQRGYAKGAYNAGLAYKYGHGAEQNSERSTMLIDKATQMGFRKTDYAIGYAHYKGIGRKQDYTKAIEYYTAGAEKGDASCMFSLGYCYLRGRGVERNVELGKQWIEKSANKGYNRAVDFITKVDANSFGAKPRTKSAYNDEIGKLIPKTRRQVKKTVGENTSIAGKWTGRLITYDWSGKEIEEELPLTVIFEQGSNTLSGFWIENNRDPISINAQESDTTWIFDNVQLNETKRPIQMKEGVFKMESKEGKDYLVGNISFYSETTREFTRPNYVVLKRENVANSIVEEKTVNISVSPNPFFDKLNIDFMLLNEEVVSIKIFDIAGKICYNETSKTYPIGKNNVSINTSSFGKGNYVLLIESKNLNYSTVIMK